MWMWWVNENSVLLQQDTQCTRVSPTSVQGFYHHNTKYHHHHHHSQQQHCLQSIIWHAGPLRAPGCASLSSVLLIALTWAVIHSRPVFVKATNALEPRSHPQAPCPLPLPSSPPTSLTSSLYPGEPCKGVAPQEREKKTFFSFPAHFPRRHRDETVALSSSSLLDFSFCRS